jgi:hypothetical protein
MTETIFIRLLAEDDKVTTLNNAVQSLHDSSTTQPTVYTVNPQSFSQVLGSPFAYWVSDKIRELFVKLPHFESEERKIKVGLQTGDDFRFVRLWWEVSPYKIVTGNSETTPDEFRQQTFDGKRWVPLVGSFCKRGRVFALLGGFAFGC